MRRLSRCSKKGQWFIISAVVLSGVFLSLSVLFKTYSKIDIKQTATETDFYFWNIKEGLQATLYSGCSEQKFQEFEKIVKERLEKNGIFVFLNYTGKYDCLTKNSEFGIMLATDNEVLYQNVEPNSIIPDIIPS